MATVLFQRMKCFIRAKKEDEFKIKTKMFTTQFNKVLLFNPIKENSTTDKDKGEWDGRFQKVQHRKYENSVQTMEKIKNAGLDCDIDDVIEVEKKYRI